MAVTGTSSQISTAGFLENANSSDWSGAETIKAAPGAGVSIHLTHLIINNGGTAQNFTVGAGESGSAVDTTIVGPIYVAANSAVTIPFRKPVKLAANTALVGDASGSTAATIIAQGFVE